MNPEHAALNSIDRRTRGIEIAETAGRLLPLHEKYAAALEKISIDPRSLINPDDPNDLYTEEMIARDEAEVARLKAEFALSDREAGPNGLSKGDVRKLAEILEYQVIRGVNIGQWLPYCRGIKTSDFDDYKNGMDLVVEFAAKNGPDVAHLGLGVDVSFSHNLGGKFSRIKDDIDRFGREGQRHNRMGVVKYFRSDAAGIRGELSGLSRVVAGLDTAVIEDLVRTRGEGIKGHIAGHLLVSNLGRQLETYSEYAEEANPAAVPNLERARRTIQTIDSFTKSSEIVADSGYTKNRDMDEAITEGLRIFK
jgi:hypothetical protein